MFTWSTLGMSRASRVGLGSGGSDAMPCHSEMPKGSPIRVTASIPMSAAPGIRLAESATIAQKPRRQSTGAAAISSPAVTNVASLSLMMSAF